MTYTMKPLPIDPATLTGLSERLILSHYETITGQPFTYYVDAFTQNIHWDNVAKRYASITYPP